MVRVRFSPMHMSSRPWSHLTNTQNKGPAVSQNAPQGQIRKEGPEVKERKKGREGGHAPLDDLTRPERKLERLAADGRVKLLSAVEERSGV